jgi:hypothetical protein
MQEQYKHAIVSIARSRAFHLRDPHYRSFKENHGIAVAISEESTCTMVARAPSNNGAKATRPAGEEAINREEGGDYFKLKRSLGDNSSLPRLPRRDCGEIRQRMPIPSLSIRGDVRRSSGKVKATWAP